MLERTLPPPSKTLNQLKFAPFESGQLTDKVTILEVKSQAQPIVQLEFIFEGGKCAEKVYGTSWFAAKGILEGTSKLSSQDIALKFESLGSYIEIVPGMDYMSIKLYTLTKNLDQSFDLLSEIILDATFPEEGIQTLKDIRLNNIENMLARNSQFANLAFNQKLYGSGSVYGKMPDPKAIASNTIEQIKDHYTNRFFQNPLVVLTGSYPDSFKTKLSDFFKQLKLSDVEVKELELVKNPGYYSLQREKSTQASIRIGKRSINREHSDIHKLSFTNTLLGGYFGSRLMKQIREEKGLTYGIYSSIAHLNYSSYLLISAEVQKAKLSDALDAIDEEIHLLMSELPSDQELVTIRNYMVGKLQNSMDSIFSIAEMYKSLIINGHDLSFISNYLNTINDISSEDIRSMAQKYLADYNEVTLIVN